MKKSALRAKCAYFVVSSVLNWHLFSCRSWKWQKTKRPKPMPCQLCCRYSTSQPFMLEPWPKSRGSHCSKGSCCRRSARLGTILSRYFHGVFIINCLTLHWKGTNIQSHFLFPFVQGKPGPHISPSLPVQAPSSPSFSLYFLPILQPVTWQKKTKSNTCIFLSNKVLMEAACSGDVFKPTNLADDPIMLNIDSTAVVRNVAIFQHFLLNWKIWEKAKQGVLEMLLATIDILVHGSHCYYEFNIVQFQKAQLVQQILIGCQVRINIK